MTATNDAKLGYCGCFLHHSDSNAMGGCVVVNSNWADNGTGNLKGHGVLTDFCGNISYLPTKYNGSLSCGYKYKGNLWYLDNQAIEELILKKEIFNLITT